MSNIQVVTKEVYTTVGRDIDVFDELPRPIRCALAECHYEYSAGDVLNVLALVRRDFPRAGNNIFRNITEKQIIEECARHIRDTDIFTQEKEQEALWHHQQLPLSTNSTPSSIVRRSSATKRTELTANQWETIRRGRGMTPLTGKKSPPRAVFFLDGPVTRPPNSHTKIG